MSFLSLPPRFGPCARRLGSVCRGEYISTGLGLEPPPPEQRGRGPVALVSFVAKGSPAEAAGIRAGDEVWAAAGRGPTGAPVPLEALLAARTLDVPCDLTLRHPGQAGPQQVWSPTMMVASYPGWTKRADATTC